MIWMPEHIQDEYPNSSFKLSEMLTEEESELFDFVIDGLMDKDLTSRFKILLVFFTSINIQGRGYNPSALAHGIAESSLFAG